MAHESVRRPCNEAVVPHRQTRCCTLSPGGATTALDLLTCIYPGVRGKARDVGRLATQSDAVRMARGRPPARRFTSRTSQQRA